MSKEIRSAVTLENQGEKIFGILHSPLNCKEKVPAVLICPGFAGNKCGKRRLFVRLAQRLSEEGIAVLRFDYRGAGDSEGEFENITIESKVSDSLVCLEFLCNQSFVDKNKIGILGRSLGGVIALLTANRFKRVKSLALWAPVFSPKLWQDSWMALKKNPEDKASLSVLKNMPAAVPNASFLKEFFSLDIKQELESLKSTPLLHLHGLLDSVVPLEHAESYKQERKHAKAPSEFLLLERSDHDFSDEKDQEIAINQTVNWFKNSFNRT